MTALPGTPVTRWFLAAIILTAAVVASMVGAGIAAWQGTRTNQLAIEKAAREAEDATKQSERNEAILRIILAVTGCRLEDTPEQCAERIHQANLREGERRISETECRFRAALAGKPPTNPGELCQ